METKQRLGELLVEQHHVTPDIIERALRIQVGGNRRLGHILVTMKAITADQLAEALADHLGQPVCTIAQHFALKNRNLIPRYLCRQYGVLPLAEKANNTLEVAMANPADEEAIRDLEQYTGMAIEPRLARQSEIDREISLRIPFSRKDFFSPRSSTLLTRFGLAACLLLTVALGMFTYRYIQTAQYGTVSVTDGTTLYKNHDLMLAVDSSGKFTLLGRGAYAQGFYSATFSNQKNLNAFLDNKKSDLSDKQKDWLGWVLKTQRDPQGKSLVAIGK